MLLKTISMDPVLWDKLIDRADEMMLNHSAVCRLAIKDYLKENENGNQEENKPRDV